MTEEGWIYHKKGVVDFTRKHSLMGIEIFHNHRPTSFVLYHEA